MNRSFQIVLLVVALVTAGVAMYSVFTKSPQRLRVPSAVEATPATDQRAAERRKSELANKSPTTPAPRTLASRAATSPKSAAKAIVTEAPSQSVIITARLRCPRGQETCAPATEARVGLGRIDPADRVLWMEDHGKAPTDDELVNIRQWRHAVVAEAREAGLLVVGPVELPRSDAYDVLAWNHTARVFYHVHRLAADEAATTGVVDLGILEPQPYTGVELTLVGEAEELPFRALLSRVPAAEPEKASQFLQLAQVMAPEFTDAFLSGEPVPLIVGQPNILAPLPPDEALQVTLISPTEIEAEPVQIPLVEGKIVNASIALSDAFPQGALASVDLEGRLEIGSTGKPLVGAHVIREIGLRREVTTTDETGMFRVTQLPMDRITSFDLETSPGAARRPVVPTRWHFEFAPPMATTGTVIRQRWQVPAYSYLVLDLTAPACRDALALATKPFPVYAVEHWDGATWRPATIDHFDIQGDEVAAAIEEPGRYRMSLAANAVAAWYSEPVTVSREGETVRTRLADAELRHEEVRVIVKDAATGEPVSGVAVTAIGELTSLPPLRLISNKAGEVRMIHHGCSAISVWVEHRGYAPVQRTLSSGELRGEVEIRVSPSR